MFIVKDKVSIKKLKKMAKEMFGSLVKVEDPKIRRQIKETVNQMLK